MRYMGGKSRIAKRIAEAMLNHVPDPGDDWPRAYVEPFLGGGAVAEHMAPHFDTVRLNDKHPDLMRMWNAAIYRGWLPRTDLTREDYEALRHAEPSALRGFYGFGVSYGGKWLGGFAQGGNRNHAEESARTLARNVAGISQANGVILSNVSYEHMRIWADDVVYCDPPYAGTTGYTIGEFNHAKFWATAAKWSMDGANVFVSEYSAPEGWIPIWTGGTYSSMDHAQRDQRVEKLFVYRPGATP